MKRGIVGLCMAVLLCVGPPAPAPAAQELSELDAFLAKLDEARAHLTDFSAAFRQLRYASLFDDTKLSTGRVTYRAPDEMLWEYQTPDRSFLRLGKEDVRFYFPLLEQIEVYPRGAQGNMSSLMDSFNGGAGALRETYEITLHPPGSGHATIDGADVEVPDAPGLRLTPLDAALLEQFSRVDFWVRPDTFVPCLLIIEEPTGDRTTFHFTEIRTNQGLDDAALDFHAPPDTEVIRVDTDS